MCGIIGSLRWRDGGVDVGRVIQGLRALDHRGPDDEGLLLFDAPSGVRQFHGKAGVAEARHAAPSTLALAACRLAILDCSAAGHQPMASPDGRLFLIYNGEIANYIELRAELEALGHRFVSRADTEVLLHAFQQWGPACLVRLSGMFAFAVLDIQARRLFLARDFFGIKPLYYSTTEQGFSFASQAGALLEGGGVRPSVNPHRLYDYLAHGITDYGDQTLFAEVRQLPPGHYLDIPLDGPVPDPVCYWRIPLDRHSTLSFEQAAEVFRELFLDSVQVHLRSDVPVASALSGGLDSASLLAAMRHAQGRDAPIHTFTFVAPGKEETNEEPWANLAGSAGGAVMHKVYYSPQILRDEFDRLMFLQDAPFSSPVVFAQLQIFREAHELGFKVLLSGQGPDEYLAGYHPHIAARMASLLRQGRWTGAAHLLRRAAALPYFRPGYLSLRAVDLALPAFARSWARRGARRFLTPHWVDARWFRERGVAMEESQPPRAGRLAMRSMLHEGMVKAPLPAILRFEDRNSMAFTIENRVPFLTPALVEFAFSLPEEYLVAPDGTVKALQRRAMRGLVPDAILDRKDKMGFPVPLTSWIETLRPWVNELLDEASRIPAVNPDRVRKASDLAGSSEFSASAFLIWRLVFLAGWARRFQVVF
ncbi:MAG: asparagine synthase (glutamine-hydrolyzing) [Acidobacteria bacterium]|nr:asparagine synthase (glutamine-hydrolyzing) [Acidobacteriota bacterium]